MAIRSFKDRFTEAVFLRMPARRLPSDVRRRAQARLLQLDLAAAVADMRSPPGNRLEALAADRVGFYSVRVNDQWRICFRWTEGGAEDVELVDYH